ELLMSGHQAIAAQIQNGIYPPRHGTFPHCLFRYHYGFDLLVALVGSMTRLSVERSIDVVTLASLFYAWCLAWGIGERVAGEGRGWIVPITLRFAGPFAFFFPPMGRPEMLYRWLGIVQVGRAGLNPCFASYFFQHPWSISVPLALAVLRVALEPELGRAKWRAGVLLVLFLA